MNQHHKYIAVDEFDNVVGYYATLDEANGAAEFECGEAGRDVYVLQYEQVAEHTFTGEDE
jgi:hypothetical protein